MSFLHKLPKPFFIMAPMANVTDAAFRRIIAKYGKPDVMYTEFVSANGLLSPGREVLLKDLLFSEVERPIIAQLFTADPEKMYGAAKLIQELGFDGLDINMGCPDKNVMKQGAGACLMKNPSLARELMKAAKAGAPNIPLSIKTRIGDTKNTLQDWLPELLAEKPEMIIVHGRTRKEMSKVPARWDTIAEAVEIARGSGTLIVGNGDAMDIADARAKAEQTGCDGVMLGRAIFGNPWLFNTEKNISDISISERLSVMIEHSTLFMELLGDIKSFHIMRKHYKAYANGFDGAKELRIELMKTENIQEVEEIVKKFLQKK
ncbi:tRNA-dihydrouridine synthase [Candidatus Falkowbacteria bacterium]|nr:MAG: tRNA-dihydrouridine synthase [Candidatus Falkowbacteria bacterium]